MAKPRPHAAVSFVERHPPEAVVLRKSTLAEDVYRKLAKDIVAGRLLPGQKLGFEILRREYGYGFTPLREALQRLASENLVDAEGNVGFRVAPISLKDLEDINALRLLLEPRALHDSISHGGMEWETQVVSAAHKLSRMPMPKDPKDPAADEWDECHRQFHDALISACTSPWLLQFCRMLFSNFARYRRIILGRYWASAALRSTIDAEHRLVVDAALNHEADKASVLLAKHYANSAERIVTEYRKLIANEAS